MTTIETCNTEKILLFWLVVDHVSKASFNQFLIVSSDSSARVRHPFGGQC